MTRTPRGGGVMIDLKPLTRFLDGVRAGRSASSRGAMHGMYRKWGVRYLNFAFRRFVRNSRGGGGWPAHKGGTREAHAGSGTAKVLIDTGVLRDGLQVGRPGNRFQRVPGGISCGYGGTARHPVSRRRRGKRRPARSTTRARVSKAGGKRRGGQTAVGIAQLAAIHQAGNPAGNLPAREIIVPPDAVTVRGMLQDAKQAMLKLGRGSQ